MSKFDKYASRINMLAADTRRAYQDAADALERAEAARRANPTRNGYQDAASMAKAAQCEATYQAARAAYERVCNRELLKPKIDAIRAELRAAVEDHYSADPRKIDAATVELLKSGIMSPGEYQRLMNKAYKDDNPTMARLIGKYAADAAAARETESGDYDETANQLRAVSVQAYAATGADIMESFDALASTLYTCADNPAMFDEWESLTGGMIEAFE